jgi:TolB-like protein
MKSLNQLLREGNTFLDAKDYRKALDVYNKALQLDINKSRKAIIYHFLARTQNGLGNGVLVVDNLAKFIDAARAFDLNNEADRYVYNFYHIQVFLREARAHLTRVLKQSPPSRNSIGFVSLKDDSEGITQFIEKGFIDVSPFKVIESKKFEEVLKGEALSPESIVDDTTVVAIGKAAGLNYVILGYVKKIAGDKILINIRLIDTDTGALVAELSEKTTADQARSLGDSIARTICADFFIKSYFK